jgi:formamidopyrimidine-DNA glycosylase
MPELVDVEIARRNLQRWMRGATVADVHATDRYVLRPSSPAAFRSALVGRSVRDVGRRGKWLRVELDGGMSLFSHLGMTGDWEECEPDAAKPRSERARFDLVRDGDRASVCYLDARRFGRLVAARADIPEWSELGPDPLADGLTARSLAAPLARSRRSVKEVLMDQTAVAGIGNILATEGLWYARIDPRSRSDALEPADVRAVVRGLRTAIRRELRHKPPGAFDLHVYGRGGQPCPRCGTTLVRITLGGRSTTLCPHCQVRRRAG